MPLHLFTSDEAINDRDPEARARVISQLIVIGLVTIAILILALRWKSKQEINSIVIEGVKSIRAEEVLALASIRTSDTTDVAPSSARLSEIQQKVMKHPYIKQAIVESNGVKGLKITVEERQPYAAFPSVMGKIDYVDSTGVVLPYDIFSQQSDVPVVHGLFHDNSIDKKVLASLKDILESAKKKDLGLQELLSEIEYDARQNLYTFITTDGETRILFGSADNIEKKLEKLRLYMIHTSSEPIHAHYVDVRWKNQIVIGKSLMATAVEQQQ